MTLSIQLPDDAERRLRETANRLHVPVAELAAAAVRDFVAAPAEDFDQVAKQVLDKNSELYRRLAQVRYLTLGEVLTLHERLLTQSGGGIGLRDLGALESAVAQPRMTFAGHDLYPDLPTKAAALAFSLIQNHPFVDGNKRIGHAALEAFLLLNGYELRSSVDAAEEAILGVAAGRLDREGLLTWVRRSLQASGS